MYVFLNLDSEAGACGPLVHLGPGCDSFPQSSSHAAEESAPGVAENSWNVGGAQLGWRQGRRRDSPSSPGAGPGLRCLPLLHPTRFSGCVSPWGQGLLSAVSCDQGPSGVTAGCGGAFLFLMQPFKTFLAGRIGVPLAVFAAQGHTVPTKGSPLRRGAWSRPSWPGWTPEASPGHWVGRGAQEVLSALPQVPSGAPFCQLCLLSSLTPQRQVRSDLGGVPLDPLD